MKRKRFKKFFKRLCALLTAMMILFFTGLDSFIYKPMQAYAAAVAVPAWLGGAAGSVFADLFYSFGIGKTTFETSSTYALSKQFVDYVDAKKESYDTSGEEDLSKLLEPIGYMTDTGQIRTYNLSAQDVVNASSFIDTLKKTTETTLSIPKSFLNTMRAFCVQNLNFNSVDGLVVTSVAYMSALDWFNMYPSLPLSGYTKNGRYHLYSTGKIWTHCIYLYTRDREFFALPGTTAYFYDASDDKLLSYTFESPASNGICISTLSSVWSSQSNIVEAFGMNDPSDSTYCIPLFPKGFSYSSAKFPVSIAYTSPTIDVGYADADAITWQGNPDLEQTLANQTQAATNGTRDEYVNNTITTANIDQALSYNALNYILDTIADHYGVEVDSATKDEFIASAYTDYVQGSSAEKMEQADEVMKKFVVINGTGGNNNKHFTVLDAVVSAYVTTLILKHILPEGTAAPEPETEVENIKIVQQLPKPTPDPDPGPNPDPNPNPDIDISLSGILSRLSKILDAILELPEKMVNAFKSGIESIINAITGLPEAITNSRLGQWVQSIPQSLQDILGQIKTIPDALIELGKGIAAVPGAIIDFFTIDMAQVSSAYSGMSDAFKGKFSALDQVIGVLDKDYNFSDTIPVIKMGTPDVLKYAIKDDEIVVMDLTPYANVFQWCRTILSAIMWIAFAHWVMDQFDVKFHVG